MPHTLQSNHVGGSVQKPTTSQEQHQNQQDVIDAKKPADTMQDIDENKSTSTSSPVKPMK
jgi:hypothetical protein